MTEISVATNEVLREIRVVRALRDLGPIGIAYLDAISPCRFRPADFAAQPKIVLYARGSSHVFLNDVTTMLWGPPMHAIRIVVVLACAVAALGALAPPVLAASNPIPIHIVKDCSMYDGEVPSLCRISESDMAALPPGTNIWYKGPVLTNTTFLSSNVLIDAGNNSTATGYCIFDARATASTGLCTFWSGTGNLTGFTAIFHVSIDAQHLWHLDGVYYFDGEVRARRSPGHAASPRPS